MKSLTIFVLLMLCSFTQNDTSDSDFENNDDSYSNTIISTEDFYDTTSYESSNSTDIKYKKKFILVSFEKYNFKRPNISFNINFKRIYGNFFPKYLNTTLRIFNKNIRNLEDTPEVKTITCNLNQDNNNIDEFKFNCLTETTFSNISKISIDKNISLSSDETNEFYDNEDIYYSGYANRIMDNITTETGTKIFYFLENTNLIYDEERPNFSLNGTITKEGFNQKEVTLIFNETSNKRTNIPVSCSIKRSSGNINLLDCIPKRSFQNTLDGIRGETTNTSINLIILMSDPNTSIDFKVIPNEYFTTKKDSSGLSGGAIAAIVIVCVVALIALIITVFLMKNKAPKIPKDANVLSMYSSSDSANAN